MNAQHREFGIALLEGDFMYASSAIATLYNSEGFTAGTQAWLEYALKAERELEIAEAVQMGYFDGRVTISKILGMTLTDY